MARSIGSANSLAYLGQGVGQQVLRAKAGSVAINPNDVVALGGFPFGLYPIQVSDYAAVGPAGGAAVALTTYSAYGSDQTITRNKVWLDTLTGDFFIADTYLNGRGGCQIWKYNSAGALLANVIPDSSTAGASNNVQLAALSNGNLIVLWANVAAPYSLYFSILDKALNVVVAKTKIADAATNPQANPHIIALSGGGFMVAYCTAGVGSYITIRDNTGAIVKAPTLIAGMAMPNSGTLAGPRFKMAQLSNGNIALAIVDTVVANQLQYCIYDIQGNTVFGISALVSGINIGGNNGCPEISVLPGYFCIVNVGAKLYVVNNAGVQGGAIAAPPSAGSTPGILINDGTYFWYGCYENSVGFWLARISAAGAIVSTKTPVTEQIRDMFFDRGGALVMCSGNNSYVFQLNQNGTPSLISTAPFAMETQVVGNIGDFCAIGLQLGKFNIVKYLNASVLGISLKAVAAGSAGTLVEVNAGPGGYITNEIRGSVAKAYDHSGVSIAGNKGALYLNSVSLKGVL
jgi:hypothetical protein